MRLLGEADYGEHRDMGDLCAILTTFDLRESAAFPHWWLARISVGSTCQEWQDLTLLPVPVPAAVEQQRAQRR